MGGLMKQKSSEHKGNTKLKEVRNAEKDDVKPLSKIEPMTSYSLIMANEKKQGALMLNNLILSHILNVNQKEGYTVGKNLIRKYILIDDKSLPSDKYCVISKTKRKEEGFITIGVEEQGINILLEVLNITHKGLITYANRNLSKKPYDVAYYYLATINASCINSLDFDLEKANQIVKEQKIFESPYWFKDKLILTISAISTPTKANYLKMFKMFKEDAMDIPAIVGWLGYVGKENLPDFVKEEALAHKTSQFNNNLQIIFTILMDIDSINELYFRLIPRTL